MKMAFVCCAWMIGVSDELTAKYLLDADESRSPFE